MTIFLAPPDATYPPPSQARGSQSENLARGIIRVVAVLAAGSLFAGHAQSEPAFLADLEIESTIADAVMQSRQSGSTKLRPDAWPSPRSTEPLALTGTEGLSLSAFRATLTGYYSIQTAQDVQERIATARATTPKGSPGIIGTPDGFIEVFGWAFLKLNWARATLRGDIDAANGFLDEARKVASGFTDEARDHEYWTQSHPDNKIPPGGFYEWASTLYLYLMYFATLVESEAVILPDAFDPEGYVRQTLQHVSRELTRAANTITVLTDSFPEGIR